jgi:hypothetical protein
MRYDVIMRGKWIWDGHQDADGEAAAPPAATVAEMIECLEGRIADLRELQDAGVVLASPVQDDYAFLVTENPAVAERFGFAPVDEERED